VLASRGFDVIVEDLNKIPLWIPRWSRVPTVCLVHHLFGTTAFREASWPVAWLTTAAEDTIPSVYRGVPFQSVSESTKDDLVRRGIPARDIDVIVQGIDTAFFSPAPAERSATPLLAYVGRLKRYKEVEHIIRGFAALAHPSAELHIAGTGDHRGSLEALVASLALGTRVRFLGFISEEEKRALLRRAWAVALTSPKEGWGITNVEAAACGTPAVASDSPGLRESVRNGETGFLVPHGDVAALSTVFGRLLNDPTLVDTLGERGRRFAEGLSWERAADHTEAHLQQVVRQGGV
jgi:glycosyltransferase involved in cell wall biosynthesis